MAFRVIFLLLTAVLLQEGFVTAGVPRIGFLGHLHSPHVINGTEASDAQIPYQARVSKDKNNFCGGSLISDIWVLTAAHCIEGYEILDVKLGAHDLSRPSEPGRLWYVSRHAIMHELYDAVYFNYDIGLVRLPERVPLGGKIQVIKMAPVTFKTKDFTGQKVRISGWGKMGDAKNSTFSNTLQYTDLTVISGPQCHKKFGKSYNEDVICAIGGAGVGPCYGDSGGPLVIRENDTEILLGSQSFVATSGCAGNPSGYTRISNYRDWIAKHSGIPEDY